MEELMRLFVRPPRHRYSLDSLGPSRFTLPTKYDAASRTTANVTIARQDFVVLEQRALELQCSIFFPTETHRLSTPDPFEILHQHGAGEHSSSTSSSSMLTSESASSNSSSGSLSSMPRSRSIGATDNTSLSKLDYSSASLSTASPSTMPASSMLASATLRHDSEYELLTASAPPSLVPMRTGSVLNNLSESPPTVTVTPPDNSSTTPSRMLRGDTGAGTAGKRSTSATSSNSRAKSQPSSPDVSPPRVQVDQPLTQPPPGMPCLLVLHGNSGSRTVALELLELVCGLYRMALCTFDFAGCGRSAGEYITLGHTEPQQIQCVVTHLRDTFNIGKIGFYGISMGAASALLYTASCPADCAPDCLILDGSFANLYHLSKEILNTCSAAVASIAKVGLPLLRERIQRKYGLDIKAIIPEHAARSCHQPALFLHGKDDTFVSPKHCTRCFTNYAGPTKEMHLVEGDHNSPRQVDYWDAVANWLFQYLVPPSTQAEFRYTPAKLIDPAKTADHQLCFYSTRALYVPDSKSAPSSPTGSPASSPRASSPRPTSCTMDLFAPKLGADCVPKTPQFINHQTPVSSFCVLGILPDPLSFVIYRPYSMIPEQVFDSTDIQSYGALPDDQVFFFVTAGPGGQQRKHIFITTKPGVIQRAFQKTLEQQFNNRITHRTADETFESIKRTARTLIDRRISTEGRVSERHLDKMAETIYSVLHEAGTDISLGDVTTIVHEIVFERTGTQAADLAVSTDSTGTTAPQKKKGCVVQ